MTDRFVRATLVALFLLFALSACGSQANAPTPASAPMTPVLAVSELTLGPNRLAFGVLQNGTPVNDPNLRLGLRFFRLEDGNQGETRSESSAIYRGEGLPFGLYVGYASFDAPGAWGVEISVPNGSGEPTVTRMRLDVLEQPSAPAVGDQAVASNTLTLSAEPDIARITSDSKPDAALYQLSIADALGAGKPFLVSFSTPGYCQTAVCAPNMLVIKQLKERYADQVNFLHVEVYPYPFGEAFQAGRRVAAMDEWGLKTEPWTFLVDGQGVIQARYEGGITFSELDPALGELAAGKPISPPTQ